MTVNTYIRTEKSEKFALGLEFGDHRPEILIYSNSPEIEDQENDGVAFEDLLYDARNTMENWQYKGYCKQLIKLIKSTCKDIE